MSPPTTEPTDEVGDGRTDSGSPPDRIDELNRRMDRIERKLDRLTGVLDQAPNVAATVGDVADDYARRAAEEGASVDDRVEALEPVLMRLSEPEVLETLEMLLERTDRIQETVELLDSLEGGAAMVGDVVDSYAMELEKQGAGVDERLQAFGQLVARATEPEVLETLQMIVERNESLREAVEMIDQMPGTLAMIVDMFDEVVMEASRDGIDVVEFSAHIARAAEEFATLVQSVEFQELMDSGVLAPKAVRAVGAIGDAVAEASGEEPEGAGFFDALGALRRTNVRHALNFVLRVGEHFGDSLESREFGGDYPELPEGRRSPDVSPVPEE